MYKRVYGKLVKWEGIMCGSLCVGDKKDTFEECVREYVRVCWEGIFGRKCGRFSGFGFDGFGVGGFG